MSKLTTEEFIRRAQEIHGDKYDYSEVEYTDCTSKVHMICPYHGAFMQSPSLHLSGCGCSLCSRERVRKQMFYTTEKFIEKAMLLHKGFYDYSKTQYIDSNTDVCIICPKHGEFFQKPATHLQGRGCPKCGRLRANSKTSDRIEKFIEKARKVHGDKYDYSLVEYINSKTHVKIICPKHGVFEQTPNTHLKGAGCPKCYDDRRGKGRQLDTKEFIRRACEIHGDKYDYSKTEYNTTEDHVCIICKEHGEFWQRPHSHLAGRGCDKCASKLRNIPKTHEKFLEQAREVHGDFYEYPETYKNKYTKIEIICPEHGSFWQTPDTHLQGSGCQKCGVESRANMRRQTTQEFVNKLIEKRGEDGYSFEKVVYNCSKCNIIVTCEEYGDFEVDPYNFLNGSNHPLRGKNSISVIEGEVLEFVKELHSDAIGNIYGIIGRKELDIYIPSLNKAIEFNGEYWHYHSKHFKPGKHAEKSNLCKSKGIKLLHLRGDLWKKDKEKMKKVILKFLNL